MGVEKKRFLSATSVLVGTCIGAGVLGIPYVAAKSGFFVAVSYILALGLLVLLINLYLGEISLRTKGDHQISGYAKKYLGHFGKRVCEFATIFSIYSAIVAYMLGVGESMSYLYSQNGNYVLFFGILFGLIMSLFLYKGINALKKFEKIGVSVILVLLLAIFFIFFSRINPGNFLTFDPTNLFLPFGVVLFAFLSFHAVPELEVILKRKERLMKKVLISGTIISIIFYLMFATVVVGFMGSSTPEIATLALGSIFVFLGIFTMFTSYLSLGNALIGNFNYDDRFSKFKSWFLSAIVPIFLFVLIRFFNGYFSFTKILSIGGAVSGGIIAILILFMVSEAKEKGNRRPEYSIPINKWIIWVISLVFILGILIQFF